jgi:hypothetical protein
MATRGTRDGTRFQVNGVQYYTLIESDGPNKGQITIKSPTVAGNVGGANLDRTVGVIPLDNAFKPELGSATSEETQFFSSANGQRQVKNQAVITSVKSGLSEPEARQLIFPNTAAPGGTPPPASTDSTTSQDSTTSDVNNIVPADLNSVPIASSIAGTRTDFGSDDNLRYPINLDASKQDCIKFSMETNEGRNLGGTGAGGVFGTLGNRVTTEIKGSVTLPIQSGITDSNGVEWGGANLDAKDRYLASLALGGIQSQEGLGDNVGNLLGRVFKDLKNASNNPDIQSAINVYLAQEAVGIQGLLSRSSGAIINPNLELLFNGPTLRSFTFTFRLSPRSQKEAANVRRIIRYFKEGMVVKTAEQEIFLKSPNIFNIQYLSNNALHKSLPRIKKCALLGCDVDYTPDGTYMTFNDEAKTMTSYQLSLRFSELEPLYSRDYKEKGLQEDAIGY